MKAEVVQLGKVEVKGIERKLKVEVVWLGKVEEVNRQEVNRKACDNGLKTEWTLIGNLTC
jgi:hypothetical protein